MSKKGSVAGLGASSQDVPSPLRSPTPQQPVALSEVLSTFEELTSNKGKLGNQ